MAQNTTKIVPDELFYSTFRNLLNVPLFIWWAGTCGKTVPPGARFKVEGDPRFSTLFLSRSYSAIQSIKSMVEQGRIEFCASPAVILDNQVPDGQSSALIGTGGTSSFVDIPVAPVADGGDLPYYKAAVSYSSGVITVDWSRAESQKNTGAKESPLNKFLVQVYHNTVLIDRIDNGNDRMLKYVPKILTGKYKFTIITVGVGGKSVGFGPADEVTLP
jgi:hypothetical protein